jgi:hypothetical protein
MNCIINMTMRMVEFSGRRRKEGEMRGGPYAMKR